MEACGWSSWGAGATRALKSNDSQGFRSSESVRSTKPPPRWRPVRRAAPAVCTDRLWCLRQPASRRSWLGAPPAQAIECRLVNLSPSLMSRLNDCGVAPSIGQAACGRFRGRTVSPDRARIPERAREVNRHLRKPSNDSPSRESDPRAGGRGLSHAAGSRVGRR